jgi:hypothetical protein
LLEELLGRIASDEAKSAGGGEDRPKALASMIDFQDALWIPERPTQVLPGWSPLALDIVNPHHPGYYTSGGSGKRRLPRDSDEPSPVHRLTVTPGCRFLVVLEVGRSPGVEPWLDWLIERVMLPALEEDGIGAWSAAGYGRLRPVVGRRPQARSQARSPELIAAWQKAHLFRIRGSGELVAILADGKRASVRGREAQEQFERLPERLQNRLERKKQQEELVEVRALPEGGSWKLVEIREVEVSESGARAE